MSIMFTSDSSYVDQGFTAEYEAFVPTNRETSSFKLLLTLTLEILSDVHQIPFLCVILTL